MNVSRFEEIDGMQLPLISILSLMADTSHLKESDGSEVMWSRSCAPDSNLRKTNPPSEGKSQNPLFYLNDRLMIHLV